MRGFLFAAALACAAGTAAGADRTFAGDATGRTPVTQALQQTIDAVAAEGGGTVLLTRGTYLSGALDMRSRVTLRLEKGATLLGTTNILDYARNNALVRFLRITDAAIVGEGTVDGNGGAWPILKPGEPKPREYRPQTHLVDMREAKNIRLEGVTFLAGGSWTIHPRRCDGLHVKGITLKAHRNQCNDGIDIESRNVLIEDSFIDAEDDAIVLKASDPDIVTENVEVRNCTIASSCAYVKFGTETYGRFRNVNVHDCKLIPPARVAHFNWYTRAKRFGIVTPLVGLSGLAVEMVDGGTVEDVTFRNIEMAGAMSPIFIRLNRRHANAHGAPSYLRNVLIENVRGSATSATASSITGLADMPVENIVLRNVHLTLPGGGTAADAAAPVPEKEAGTPESTMFGGKLPAYGCYLRHARNVTFENVRFTLAPGAKDARPPIVTDDVTGFRKN